MIVIRRVRPRSTSRRSALYDPLTQAFVAQGFATNERRRVWQPPVEAWETPSALEVVAEIAGMESEEIDVIVEGDALLIQGTRRDATECEHRTYHVANIGYGPFAVELRLPFSVEAEQAEATYDNGFLRLSIPRSRGRTIIPTRSAPTQVDPEERDA